MQKILSPALLNIKINELKYARLYCDQPIPGKIANPVVHVLSADNQGNIWCTIPADSQKVWTGQGSFTARLIFLKKGFRYFLQISGVGGAITDAAQLLRSDEISRAKQKHLERKGRLLVKIRVIRTDLTDQYPGLPLSWLEKTIGLFRKTVWDYFPFKKIRTAMQWDL